MNNQQLASWAQIGTGLVLIFGLILVMYELGQAKQLALAELTSQGYSEALEDFRAVMGENPAPTIAKACFEPDALTPEELVVLQSYLSSQINQISRLRVLEQVADFGVPWRQVASQLLVSVLSIEHGRWWFQGIASGDEELMQIGERVLALNPNCEDFYTQFSLRGPHPEQASPLDILSRPF